MYVRRSASEVGLGTVDAARDLGPGTLGAPKAKNLNILAKRMPFQSVFVTPRGNRKIVKKCLGAPKSENVKYFS